MEYTAPVPGVATTTRVVSKRQCSPKGFNSSPEGRTTRFSPGTAGSKPAHGSPLSQEPPTRVVLGLGETGPGSGLSEEPV